MFIHESLVPKVVVAGPSDLELLIISVHNHVSSCKHHIGLFTDHPPVVFSLEKLYTYFESLDLSYFSNFVFLGDLTLTSVTNFTFCTFMLLAFLIVFHFIRSYRVTLMSALLGEHFTH